jgi:hypothetical protein
VWDDFDNPRGALIRSSIDRINRLPPVGYANGKILATFKDGGAIWAKGITKLEGFEEFALRCFLLFGNF